MGSPMSGIIVEAVMQRLEASILPVVKPKMGICYIDDPFVIFKKDELENTNNLINNVFDYIKFTVKQKSKNKLPFLGVLITRTDAVKLETQVYRKLIYTDRILNQSSNISRTHK